MQYLKYFKKIVLQCSEREFGYFRNWNTVLIEYNREEAKRIFDSLGLSEALVIRTPTKNPPNGLEIATFIQAELADIGVKSTIDVQENRHQYALELRNKEIGDIAILDSSTRSTFRVLSEKISSTEKGPWWQGIIDPVVDDLITVANREADITTRERKYAATLKHLNQNPHWIYLTHPNLINASKPEITSIESLHTGILRFPGSW